MFLDASKVNFFFQETEDFSSGYGNGTRYFTAYL
jgi:hypothetical protein